MGGVRALQEHRIMVSKDCPLDPIRNTRHIMSRQRNSWRRHIDSWRNCHSIHPIKTDWRLSVSVSRWWTLKSDRHTCTLQNPTSMLSSSNHQQCFCRWLQTRRRRMYTFRGDFSELSRSTFDISHHWISFVHLDQVCMSLWRWTFHHPSVILKSEARPPFWLVSRFYRCCRLADETLSLKLYFTSFSQHTVKYIQATTS